MDEIELRFVDMDPAAIPAVVDLISRSMNTDEGRWSQQTFEFHFSCASHGLSDGRKYFLAQHGDQIIGIIGWHHYLWGPDDAIWSGWFAVDPAWQGQHVARRLAYHLLRAALQAGYRRLFVETYGSAEFAPARRFYEQLGCQRCGHIESYLQPRVDRVVYAIALEEALWQEFAPVTSASRSAGGPATKPGTPGPRHEAARPLRRRNGESIPLGTYK